MNPTNSSPSWPGSYPTSDDYSVINEGQLKNFATQAYNDLQANAPSYVWSTTQGQTLAGMVNGWASTYPAPNEDDYKAINLGQLKTVAKPFYDVLLEMGYVTSYPWTGVGADDYSVANIGQVKNLFSFDVGLDSDNNGLPDWWEQKYLGHLGNSSSAVPDGNGFTLLQDYQGGADPTNYYSQPGTSGPVLITPVIAITGGNNQTVAAQNLAPLQLMVTVTNSNGGAVLVNAPVTFTVIQGGGLVSTSELEETFGVSVSTVTNSSGQAQVYFELPGIGNVVSQIRAATGNLSVSFSESSLPSTTPTFSPGALASAQKNSTISAGASHTVTLRMEDGAVFTGGDNTYGQLGTGDYTQRTIPVQVPNVSKMIAVAAGDNFTMALRSDGTVWTWGDGQFGQLGNGSSVKSNVPVQVSNLSNVVAIAAGEYHALAVRSDGTVWAWGTNTDGELGNGTTTPSNIPVQVSSLSGIVAVAGGQYHSAALMSNGTVWTWGLNTQGELGNGSNTNSHVPVQVSSLTSVIAITAGTQHCEALKSDGTIWAWGDNANDELGSGNTTSHNTPVQVSTSSGLSGLSGGVTAIASFGFHTVVLTNAGVVWTWGSNTDGELGNNSTTASAVPVNLGLGAAVTVGAGIHHTIVVLSSNGAVAQAQGSNLVATWGNNSSGELGMGTTSNSLVPVLSDFTNVGSERYLGLVGGAYHTLCLQLNGTLYAWGDNGQGQLGNGTTANSVNPVQVVGLMNVAGAAAGGYHSLAVETNGTVWAWGFNQFGQLGNGTTTQSTTPVAVSTLSNITAVAAGYEHSLALRGDGTVWAWGYNGDGELGNGTTTSSSTPVQVSGLSGVKAIAVRGYHSLALKSDGTVWAWGYNNQGQLGNGSTTSSSTPVQVSGITTAISIAGGGYFSAAIESNGTVWTWGDNTYGQLGDGTNTNRSTPVQPQLSGAALSNAVLLALGDNHTLVLRADGTTVGFGANYSGQLDNGNTINQSTPQVIANLGGIASIAAGGIDSLASESDGSGIFGWGDDSLGQYHNNGLVAINGTAATIPLPAYFAGSMQASIAGGGNTSMAIRKDGSLWTWGDNSNGQLGTNSSVLNVDVPGQATNLANITSVAVGYAHGIALKNDGTVWTWGNGVQYGQLGGINYDTAIPTQVYGIYGVTSVAAGAYHSLVTRVDGSVWAWGDNVQGDVGNGNTTSQYTPVQVIGLSGMTMMAVAGGYDHSVALSSSGNVWAWGDNTYGQLGNNTRTQSSSPVEVQTATGYLTGIVAIASGLYTNYALKNDGTVWAWGHNNFGQIGNGTTGTDSLVAIQLTALSNITAIAAGDYHALAIRNDTSNHGTLWSWGHNSTGQLGRLGETDSNTPGQIPPSSGITWTGFVAISAGSGHSMAVQGSGQVYCWGNNSSGQIGSGSLIPSVKTTPFSLSFYLEPSNMGLAVGSNHSAVFRADGTLWSWGANTNGQLGTGSTTSTTIPVQVSSVGNVTCVAAGTTFTSVVTSDGTITGTKIKTWGLNSSGQLGNGTTNTSDTPGTALSNVGLLPSSYEIGVGSAHILYYSYGSVMAAGADGSGQLGNGTTTSGATATPVTSSGAINSNPFGTFEFAGGSLHSVALGGDGTVWTWGSNAFGQLGDGTTTTRTSPIELTTTLTGVFTAVAAGGSHTMALRSDGTVWAWGYNVDGELGNGGTTNNSTPAMVSGLTQIIAIGATATNSYALRSDGTVWAWGAGNLGQLGNGNISGSTTPVQVTGVSQVIALATGSSANHMLVAESNGTIWGWGDNVNGDIGDGTSTQRNSPVQVTGFNVTQIPGTLSVTSSSTVFSSGSNITLNASLGASSDPIQQVAFYQGTTLIGTTTSSPYAFNWATVAPGTYTITAVATDINGVTTTSSPVRIKVMKTGYDSVVANGNDVYAVRSDGTVWSWGQNGSGELGVGSLAGQTGPAWVAGVNNAVSMAAGGSHAIALTSSGTVWTWGDNVDGNLGLGTTTAISVPQQLSSFANVAQVASGTNHTVALSSDGTVWIWGDNTYGQLGTGNNTSSSVPVQIPPGLLNGVIAIDARANATMALKSDGTVWAWGNNSNGQLGNGTTTNSNVPVQVSTITNVTAITCGNLYAGAVTSTGAVYTWGSGSSGQLGRGTTADSSTPVLISALTNIAILKCGVASTFAINTSGTVFVFGNNSSGQLGLGSSTAQFTTPQTASNWAGMGQFSSSTNNALALRSDGTVWASGSQSNGQLGNGIQNSTNVTSPVQVYSLYGTLGLANGDAHTVSFRNDGTVWSWGTNSSGQLGNDTTVNSASPVQASVVNNAVGVAAGTSFSLGLGSDGTVWSWGLNNHGQLGVPNSYTVLGIPFTLTTQRNFPAAVAGITNVIQLSAGVYDSVALKGNGTVWVWGEGTEGELGNGTSSDSSIPVQVSSLTGMIQVAAGNQHVVALQSNGTVWTWGSNSNGQLGNNSTTNSSTPVQVTALSGTFIAVGAGVNFSVALRSDGTVWAWGANPDGELGNSTTTQSLTPVQVTGLNGIIAISSGGKNTFALQNNGNLWTWGLNGNGQLGNGTTTSSSTALQVTGLTTTTAGVTGLGTGSSALHSLALIGNSAIYGWGDNTNGDLGDGTTTQRTSPTLASTVSNSPPVVAPTITLTEPGGATQF